METQKLLLEQVHPSAAAAGEIADALYIFEHAAAQLAAETGQTTLRWDLTDDKGRKVIVEWTRNGMFGVSAYLRR